MPTNSLSSPPKRHVLLTLLALGHLLPSGTLSRSPAQELAQHPATTSNATTLDPWIDVGPTVQYVTPTRINAEPGPDNTERDNTERDNTEPSNTEPSLTVLGPIADDAEPLPSAPNTHPSPAPSPLAAQAPAPPSQPPADPLAFSNDRVKLKFGLSGAAQSNGVIGSWWNLSEQYAPDAGYNPDRAWGELWIKPEATGELSLTDSLVAYSGLSYVGSGNVGSDVFDQGDRGSYSIEDAYFGGRLGSASDDYELDVSYGRQRYKIGSGMLISVGAVNGFERGATTSFPRRAWEEAGLIKLKRGPLSWDVFYLNPNELPSSDTHTRLAGSKVEADLGNQQTLGLAYLNVFESEYPYVAAPIQLIPNGREGLNTMHAFTRLNPLPRSWEEFYVAGDYAYQWNHRIDMSSNAFSLELGNRIAPLPNRPKFAYAFRSFQGDDPATARFEKFDPLFYEGSPPLWASGSNGSLTFYNSNVQSHRCQLGLQVSPRDTLSFYYWHLLAQQIDSPIQFGQAGRVVAVGGEPELVSGVPNAHLSDDFYLEHFRVLSPNWYLTTGFAVSIPGQGLRELVDDPKTWYGGLISLAFAY